MKSNNNPNNQMNTLHLGQHELRKLLEKFDSEQSNVSNPDREFVRWSFRVGAVELTIEHGNGGKVTIPVATRNISRGGMSILHTSFVHLKSPCEVTLKLPGGNSQIIPGKIVRCNHLQGRIHEVGIAFNEQISTKELLGLDPLNEAYSLERVEADRLHGSILIVTPTDLDRDLIMLFLEDTNLVLNVADSIESAVSRAAKGCDIVLADYHLKDETGPELINALREANCESPVIVMTSDKSESALDAIRDAQAAGMLSKPLTKHRLLQALGEFLHADGDGGPLYSTLSADNPALTLVGKFLSDVPRMTLNLEKAMREDDMKSCLEICRTLSGTASPLGFPDVSTLAIAADKIMTDNGLKAAAHELRSVIIACRRIKATPAAA
ncbi:MAG: response regulator [Phycisphaerales bacterium]|nr:response regulator [Phycisphaerales bacterium]